jgi:hypothetical protein
MEQLKVAQAGILTLALVFGTTMIACGGEARQGGDGKASADLKQAANAAESAVKDAAGKAVSAIKGAAGGGKPAEATDFVYRLNTAKDGVVITGIQKDAKFGAHLVVPAEIEGYPVVAYLVEDRFIEGVHSHSDYYAKKRNQPPLESVVLPDSITYIGSNYDPKINERYGFKTEDYNWYDGKFRGDCSFEGCDSLKSIVFPKNLKIVPRIRDLPSLKPENITWPEALEVVGGFGDDTTTELVIPEGVKVILQRSFSGMGKLATVTIPDSIEEIQTSGVTGAFSDCPELTAVNLPAHPINYGEGDSYAFSNCPKLGIAAQKAIKDTGYTGSFR